MARGQRHLMSEPAVTDELLRQLGQTVRPLEKSGDLSPLIDRIADARHVLLGEASHGTSDYYVWRMRISKRLISDKGFRFIAVEGDWPDCYRLNRYVKAYPDSGKSANEVLSANFRRWPTWMWANEEIIELAEWMRRHNEKLIDEDKVGFYGLDVYSLWESLAALATQLREHDPKSLDVLREVVRCFEPYGGEVRAYARATALQLTSCEGEAAKLLRHLRERMQSHSFAGDGSEARLQSEQNAVVIQNAEKYYRTMVRPGPDSWNIRDKHMADTLDRLMVHHGPRAKGIVWEHNTHIGDARFTDMAQGGEFNVGQLVRERHGKNDVVLVGFSSHRGTVIAGQEWDAPMEVMTLPAGRSGSWEDVFHRVSSKNGLYVFSPENQSEELSEVRGHRAVGVVYHPQYEHLGNYVPTVMLARYDAVLFIDESKALRPLKIKARNENEPADTYPSAV